MPLRSSQPTSLVRSSSITTSPSRSCFLHACASRYSRSGFLKSKHFPANIDTPEIIDFLSLSSMQTSDYTARVDEVIRTVKGIIRSNSGNLASSISNVIKKVQNLAGCEYPGWEKISRRPVTQGWESHELRALM